METIYNQLNPAHDCNSMFSLGRIEKPPKQDCKVDVNVFERQRELALLHGPTFPDLEGVWKR